MYRTLGFHVLLSNSMSWAPASRREGGMVLREGASPFICSIRQKPLRRWRLDIFREQQTAHDLDMVLKTARWSQPRVGCWKTAWHLKHVFCSSASVFIFSLLTSIWCIVLFETNSIWFHTEPPFYSFSLARFVVHIFLIKLFIRNPLNECYWSKRKCLSSCLLWLKLLTEFCICYRHTFLSLNLYLNKYVWS